MLHDYPGPALAASTHEMRLLKTMIARHRKGAEVARIAGRLVKRFASAGSALRASPEQLSAIAGIDQALVEEFAMAREVAIAIARSEICEAPVLDDPAPLIRFLRSVMVERGREQFHALYLNRDFRLIAHEWLQSGTVDHVSIYPREVVGLALAHNATAIVLAHNHPSGNPAPSRADISMTRELERAARWFGIAIIDHVILGAGREFRFRDNGLLLATM